LRGDIEPDGVDEGGSFVVVGVWVADDEKVGVGGARGLAVD